MVEFGVSEKTPVSASPDNGWKITAENFEYKILQFRERQAGIGLVFDLLAIFIHALGDALGFFWIGLFLLGFGWNFLFVGGTTLLTKITNDENRERAQSINELAVFTAAALGSLLSGAVLARFGWANLNLVMCAALAILAMTLLLKWKSTKASLR